MFLMRCVILDTFILPCVYCQLRITLIHCICLNMCNFWTKVSHLFSVNNFVGKRFYSDAGQGQLTPLGPWAGFNLSDSCGTHSRMLGWGGCSRADAALGAPQCRTLCSVLALRELSSLISHPICNKWDYSCFDWNLIPVFDWNLKS